MQAESTIPSLYNSIRLDLYTFRKDGIHWVMGIHLSKWKFVYPCSFNPVNHTHE